MRSSVATATASSAATWSPTAAASRSTAPGAPAISGSDISVGGALGTATFTYSLDGGTGSVSAADLENEDSAPIVQLTNRIIEDAYVSGASDIHIEPMEKDLVVRYRIDGLCQEKLRLPKQVANSMVTRIKIMCNLDISERRLPQDGRIVFKKYTKKNIDIDLRVGRPALDNTHAIRGNFGGGGPTGSGATSIPVDDSPEAIRATLWYQTDRRFKSAVEQFTRVKTNVQVKIEEEDKSADFCAEPAHTYAEAPVTFSVDRRALEERVRRFTAPFSAHKNIYSADASITIGVETRWYANTEGTLVQTSQPTCRIVISAVTKADDGMVLPRFETYFAFRPEQLPSDAHVLADVKKIIADLEALRTAPIVDPYTGPAILSGRAAGVFFHEVFGHRIEGHRQKRADEGQTFKKMLGQKLLPETFNVYCDPARPKYGTTELGGHYLYDNQGVKAQRVPLIESGVFTGFLMARIPIDGFPTSNGHGRKATGASVVSRQSNLIVETTKPVSPAVLKEELRKLVVAQQKPYGLLFDDIQGGFAITGRTSPNAFNVQPIMVYRIFPDGREELVRGADFIGC